MSVGFILFLIPPLYAGIQALELSAVLARISGLASNNPMLGYSIQQSIYMGTRLLLVFMLPLLGILADSGVGAREFERMAHLSLLSAGTLGLIILLARQALIIYYSSVILRYKESPNLLRAFFFPNYCRKIDGKYVPMVCSAFGSKEARGVLVKSTFVFVIYSTGIFASFYLSVVIPEYRAALSHVSGIFNALGAFLLTFVVEPRLGMRIDQRHESASSLVLALFLGRLIAVLFAGQIFLFIFFWGANV